MKKILSFQFLQILFLVIMFITTSTLYGIGHDTIYIVYYLLYYCVLVFLISFVASIFFYNNLNNNKKIFYALNIIISLISFNIVTGNFIFNLLKKGFRNIDVTSIVICLTFIVSIVLSIISFPYLRNIVTKDSSLLDD